MKNEFEADQHKKRFKITVEVWENGQGLNIETYSEDIKYAEVIGALQIAGSTLIYDQTTLNRERYAAAMKETTASIVKKETT